MSRTEPPEPWRSFLAGVDSGLGEEVRLHCCGGFVATQLYGIVRSTIDVDFLGLVPYDASRRLIELGGKGSALYRKHKVCLDAVTIATPPEDYEERLTPMFPGAWTHLRLFALEAHDIALSKLVRNQPRDRDDVQALARAGYLNPDVLTARYYKELRPNLPAHEDRHDLTLKLWLEAYWPK